MADTNDVAKVASVDAARSNVLDTAGSGWHTGGYVGTYTWPLASTPTVQYFPQIKETPAFCQCGEKCTREIVAVSERKVKAGGDGRRRYTIVSETREAAVCAKCGVIAWFGHEAPPS